MTDYDMELDRIVGEVKKAKARFVGLQLPEGLKDNALDVARMIEGRTKAKVVIMADPTYGACDMKTALGKKLKLDLLVHFGHTKLR